MFELSWDYLYEQIQLGLLDFKPSCQGGLLDVKLMNFLSCLRTTYLTYLWVDHWTKYIVLLDIKKIFLTSAGLNVRRKTWWVGLVIVIEFRSSFLHWHRWITTTIDNDQMAMQQLKLYKFLSLLSFKLLYFSLQTYSSSTTSREIRLIALPRIHSDLGAVKKYFFGFF